MKRLLVRPKIHSDECVVSYLIRISHENGFHHLGHLLKYAGLPWKNLRAPTYQMITGEYQIKPYFNNLGLHYTKPRTAEIFETSQSPSFSTKIFVKTPKVCPKCLQEQQYCPDLWSYIAYTACTKHRFLLIDSNPIDRRRLSWYRGTLDRFSDSDSFPCESQLIRASSETLALSKTMAHLVEGKKLAQSTPSILLGLNFAEALSVIHLIAHYQYRLFNKALFAPASLDNLTASHYYTEAWKALKHWPKQFHLLLSQYIDNPMSQRGQCGINKHFRDIHEKLHRQRDNKGINRLRAAFDQFIEVNWPNALQTNRLTRISLSAEERPLIGQKEAQIILGCREPRVHSLIKQRKITPHQFKGKIYFYRHDVELLVKLYEDNWTMEQAVTEIELSRYQIKQLLDAGLIKALQRADLQNRDWLIAKASWLKTMTSFKKSASSEPVHNGISLSGIQNQGFPIADIFILIQKQKLEYNFTPKIERPNSFKQLFNFSIKL
jgi:hypothetical protein